MQYYELRNITASFYLFQIWMMLIGNVSLGVGVSVSYLTGLNYML